MVRVAPQEYPRGHIPLAFILALTRSALICVRRIAALDAALGSAQRRTASSYNAFHHNAEARRS